MTARLDAALGYAARGIPVFPCHGPLADRDDQFVIGPCSCGDDNCSRPGKHPLTRHGFRDATVYPDRITGWWDRWPQANIGIATGVAFDVLDVDGRQGNANLVAFARGRGLQLGGPVVATGRGYHLLYAPTGSGCRVGLAAGLDWRGAGGYVIAPPSWHHGGARYIWIRTLDAVDLPEASPALREQLLTLPQPERAPTPDAVPGPRGRGDRYGQAALAGEVAKVAAAIRGDRGGRGGNDTLHRAAFRCYQLVDAGLLDPDQVACQLAGAARQIGLGDAEIAGTLRSARAGAARHPRTLTTRTRIGRDGERR